MSNSWIGRRIARKEDHRFLTGQGRYTDDLAAPGAARAVMVRSPHSHARILGVDTSAARAMDGVLAVLTGRDVEGTIGPIPTLPPCPTGSPTSTSARSAARRCRTICRR